MTTRGPVLFLIALMAVFGLGLLGGRVIGLPEAVVGSAPAASAPSPSSGPATGPPSAPPTDASSGMTMGATP